MTTAHIWLAIALLVAGQAARADGKIYAADFIPEIPDQRALIAFDGARQVMLIENRLSLPDGRPAASLGWVVPVPAVPEIAVADASSVRRLYRQVRSRTDPEPVPVIPLVAVLVPVAFFYGRRLIKQNHPDGPTLRSSMWLGIIGLVLAAVAIPAGTPTGPPSSIEVVKALRVGPLDAKVVRADSATELVEWLRQNGYAYGKNDVAAIENYLRRKWLFVTAKLAPLPGTAFEGASASPPLVLSFPTREPVYPVALTAAGGRALDLVLYIYAPVRVEPSVPMPTAFAGREALPMHLFRGEDNKAVALFSALDPEPHYLTKVARKLAPDELRQDIRFVSAAAKGDFRDWIVGPLSTFWIGGAFVITLVAFLLQRAGAERWRVSAPAWFAISMLISWPLAVLLLLGSVGQQYWKYRKERAAAPADSH